MRNTRLVVLAIAALVVAACGILPGGGGGAATTLTIAAVQGGESAGLKAVEGDYETSKGVTINIEELPYPQLYEKLVTTFEQNQATYDLIMMDDPWMPKFGTDGSLQDLGQFGITRDPDIAEVIYD